MEKKITIEEMLDYIGETLIRMTNDTAMHVDNNPFAQMMFDKSVENQQMLLKARIAYDELYKTIYRLYMMAKLVDGMP